MNIKSAYIILIVVAFVVGVVVGRSLNVSSVNVDNTDKDSLVEKEMSEESKNRENKYEYVFEGEGKKVVGPFYLEDGLAFLHVLNQSGVNSILNLNMYYDKNQNGSAENNEWWDQYINVGYEDAESYEGMIPTKVQKGNYFIDIWGGRWKITVTQPKKINNKAGNFEPVQKEGQNISSMFYLDKGEYTFRASYDGDNNFIVYLVDDNGNYSAPLVNVIGKYNDIFKVKIVIPGNYFFYVNGVGSKWSIEQI